jgi:hypothetical protein
LVLQHHPFAKFFSFTAVACLALTPASGPDEGVASAEESAHAAKSTGKAAAGASVRSIPPPRGGGGGSAPATPPSRGNKSPVAGTSDATAGSKDAKSARADRAGATDGQSCPAGMVLVEGEHCPDVEQVCLKWLDPPPYQHLRCGEYAQPAKCKVPREHRRFCIDREEYVDPHPSDGEEGLPMVNKSWLEAKAICHARGARLCKESEWEFACEGPAMSPYPYGFKRNSNACNIDRTDLGGPNSKLIDHRAKTSEFPECTSPFDVHDMTGNVDEWVERENAAPPNRSALRGGWWLPGRNRCRAATLGHAESYTAKQVGFRCCSNVP